MRRIRHRQRRPVAVQKMERIFWWHDRRGLDMMNLSLPLPCVGRAPTRSAL